MRVVIGGARGTSPVARPDFMRYGGATTSVLVEDRSGTRIFLDAGTGLRNLPAGPGRSDPEQPDLLLLTHYHLDHLIGLPCFGPMYDPRRRLRFAAPAREGVTAEGAIRRLMDRPFWPVMFCAHCEYLVLPESSEAEPWRHGAFTVRWCAVHHLNGCHAFRMDSVQDGASAVFATDLEWQASDAAERAALLRLCQWPAPADLLIMDGQFDADEGPRHAGWGHSTWQDAAEVAKAAGIGQLVVTHHAPESGDAVLDERAEKLRRAFPNSRLAYDGIDLEIGKKK